MSEVEHLILSNTSSSESFPGNRPDDFTSLLKTPLISDDNTGYELALAELQCVQTIPTVLNSSVTYHEPKLDDVQPDPVIIRLALEELSSAAEFVEEIQEVVAAKVPPTTPQGEHLIRFTYDESTLKTTVTLAQGHTVTLTAELASILGFSETEISTTTTSEHVLDIHRGKRSLFVLCDQTEDIAFGSEKCGLLGFASTVKVTEDDVHEVVNKSFDNLMFVRVVENRLDRIRIYIRAENNESSQFRTGPTIVRLVVRKRSL